jgi:hypothetical protein
MHHRVVLPLLAALALVAGTPAPASAVLSSPAQGAAVQTSQARFGRTFRPRLGARPVARRPGYRPLRRPHIGRSFFRGVLRALGIAYLAHLLFGWGAGGSPFGLLLLLALVVLVVSRGRRRRAYSAW